MGAAFYIAQGVGILSIGVSILLQQLKSVKHILIGNVAINLLGMLNYLLLGGLSGAWICVAASVQAVVIFFLNRSENGKNLRKWLMLLFCAIYIVGTWIVYQDIGDLFSCVGALIYVASILQTNSMKYRFLSVPNAIVWIVYDIFTMAYTHLLSQTLKLCSAVIGILRLDLPKWIDKRRNSADEQTQNRKQEENV